MHKLVVLSLLAAAMLPAQDYRAKIQGFVTDKSGGAIPGAKVVLQNTQTAVQSTRDTNEQGSYLFDFVEPGQYQITVSSTGFSQFIQKNILVETQANLTVHAKLDVGTLSESVTVTDNPVSVQFNSPTSEQTITREMLDYLPEVSRNPGHLALMDPLVVSNYSADLAGDLPSNLWSSSSYNVGGDNNRNNDTLLDGSTTQPGRKGGYVPTMDAVQEFTVTSVAVDAEFGNSGAAFISLSMKHGTNQWHGSSYYFGRNPAINAESNSVVHTGSVTRAHIFGGTAGGPIRKNKVFSFTSYERWRNTNPNVATLTMPTDLERTGDFSKDLNQSGTLRTIYDPNTTTVSADGKTITRQPFAGNIIPQNRIDPTSQKFMKYMWAPNGPGTDITGANNFQIGFPRAQNYWNFAERIDYNVSERLKTFARVGMQHSLQLMKFYNDSPFAATSGGGWADARNFSGEAIYTLNPTTVIDYRMGWVGYHDAQRDERAEMKPGGLSEFWPNNNWYEPYLKDQVLLNHPGFWVTDKNNAFGKPSYYWLNAHTWSGSLKVSKAMGRHYLKVGSEYRNTIVDASRPQFMAFQFVADHTASTYVSPNLRLNGNAWATFLLGALDQNSAVSNMPKQTPRNPCWGLFFQDDYKITRRLTLNLGFRWEYNGPSTDPENRISRYLDLTDPIPEFQKNPPQLPAAVYAAVPNLRAPSFTGAWLFANKDNRGAWNPALDNFMPRIGAVFALTQRTAIRFGYGRYFVPPEKMIDTQGTYPYPGYSVTSNPLPVLQGVPQAVFSNPFPSTNPLQPVIGQSLGRYTNLGGPAAFFNQDMHTQGNDRLTLSVQQNLPAQMVAQFEYFGNFGFNVPYNRNLNLADPKITSALGNAGTKTVPNPFYNILTPQQFPGTLRNQAQVTINSLLTPYPQYTTITSDYSPGGHYMFQAGKIRVQRAMRNGLTLVASYAYMRKYQWRLNGTLDTYNNYFTKYQSQDPRNRLVSSAVWKLPVGKGRRFAANVPRALDYAIGGWVTSSIMRYQSGALLSFSGITVNGNPKLDHPTPDRWFDVTKFGQLGAYATAADTFALGILGPRAITFDQTLQKEFRVGEKRKLELRIEGYNLSNSIIFNDPNTKYTDANFGRATTQKNRGRELQYVLRFHF